MTLLHRALGAAAVTALVTVCAVESFSDALPVLHGRAQVADGDDIIVAARKIRLQGIDAFEWDQTCLNHRGEPWPCGAAATSLLTSIVKGREVSCVTHDWHEHFKRFVATCHLDGVDIAEHLVRAGLAFDVPKWSAGRYKWIEDEARELGAGAWAGKFTYPWDHRRIQREKKKGDPT